MFIFHTKFKEDTKVRVTIVGQHQDGVLKIAAARCSAKDNFVKKFGRKIAEGRLEKNKLYAAIPMEVCSGKEFFDRACQLAEEVVGSKIVYKPVNNILNAKEPLVHA